MFLTRQQNLSPAAIVAAVLSVMPIINNGHHNATYEGQLTEDEYLVFRISLASSSNQPRSVCLRVEHPRHQEASATILARVDAERRTYETLGQTAFRWCPRLVGSSLTFDNPIRYPFLLLDVAGEERLAWRALWPPQPARAALLARLATIQLELIQCTLETREMTAYEYYENKIQQRLKRIRQGQLPELVEQDVLDQLALLPHVLGDDKNNRHFALEHANLSADCILLLSSDQSTISTIIDWGPAEMVPLCQAARLPSLLRSWGCCDVPRQTMLEDRALYVASYADHNDMTVAGVAMQRAQTGGDVDARTLYWEAVGRESMLLMAMARGDVGGSSWMLSCLAQDQGGEEEEGRETGGEMGDEVESADFDLCSVYSDTITDDDE